MVTAPELATLATRVEALAWSAPSVDALVLVRDAAGHLRQRQFRQAVDALFAAQDAAGRGDWTRRVGTLRQVAARLIN